MGTAVGVGFSDHRNPAQVGRTAALHALAQAGIDSPDFVFVFATIGYNQSVLIKAIREATANAPLCGCSGEGIITRDAVVETNFGVAVMVIRSDELRFEPVCVAGLEEGAEGVGARLAAQVDPLLTANNLGGLLFADGLVFNFDPFLRAFERALSRPLPLFGGLAADNWAAQKTYQYHNDEVHTGAVVCVVVSGQGHFAWGISHGCVPVGTKSTVTRCRGNEIQQIDGLPALEVLQDYFDEDWQTHWNKTALNLCLGFPAPDRIKEEYGEHVIRYMMAKDDEQGSVTIQSEVDEGSDIWIVRRDKELIREGLQELTSSPA